ncbi:23S rRNA pseudouridine2457 synthase [Gillisia sp. Hel_I_86]|uniref:pseudouridine synthase n=1 Tax=Gillisia sp. Hel_I_86 TaxID=1249981 RepID=UPI001198E9F8|nr:pseudouridine synthase [Gillisia sp. Hel_I_86]TVZ27678.1 23S rRNA pseudouridine2457 synthase [Gillisia sp. Hel_I_86]
MPHQHFKIYKPYGYLSQFVYNQNTRRNKKLLGELGTFPEGTMSIGRLDEDSEGLLFLTTDGKMSDTVRSSKVEKEYYVQVDGLITQAAILNLQKGVEIGIKGTKYMTKPCKAHNLEKIPQFPARSKKIRDERHGPTSWIAITLTEGKFRQVKKMTAAVGFPTLRLVRYRIANEYIDTLRPGEIFRLRNFKL